VTINDETREHAREGEILRSDLGSAASDAMAPANHSSEASLSHSVCLEIRSSAV